MNREEARKKAEALVGKMTLEEKAEQLKYGAPALKRLGIPAYNWWNEGLHGVARAGQATVFPQAIGMAATFDTDLVKEMADVVATEGRAKYNAYSGKNDRDIYKGLTFWSPNVNIFRDPRWGRGHETYGEDPYLTSRLGVAFVEGLQGDGETMKAAACAKHFAVHSGPEAVRHEFDAEATPKDMEETYLPAFQALVQEAGVEAVMGAYNRTNGEPCCGSPKLQKILREDWGFEGHFVSDCWAIRDFHEHHMVTKNARESAALAINNGCDLNCGNTYLHILGAVQDGLVSEETITEAACGCGSKSSDGGFDSQALTILADICNAGTHATDEILQIYVKNHDCADPDKHPELCAFARIHLDAGEKKQIRIPVGHRALTVVGEDGIRRDGGKSYTFYVGCSQPDARSEELTGKRAVEIAYRR